MSIMDRSTAELTVDDAGEIERLHDLLARQKQAFLASPYPTYAERADHVRAAVAAVLAHREQIREAMAADFGAHPAGVVDLIEILGVGGRAQYVLSHLEEWMATEDRSIDRQLWGSATAQVRWQPKGVVGNMVPWNFPFDISFGPLVDMLASGNRVIVKPSDYSTAGGEVMAAIVRSAFDEDRVAVVSGGIELARTFPTLAWDHLMYTGSPSAGRSIMRSAADHLVPVTLELGGKSPVIVTGDAVDAGTVANLVGMKLLKSGQVCVAPDHVFVPRERLEEFVDLVQCHGDTVVPGHTASVDATGIITERHLDRLLAMLSQAEDAGYRVVRPDRDGVVDRATRTMPLALVIDPGPELDLSREELFGPILPVIPYDDVDEVIATINAGERPLALYVYTHDDAIADHVLERTHSGGFCVNLSLLHGALAELPFGGVGNSGMGRHHSVEGFREFSYPRSVLRRGVGDGLDMVSPPYRVLEDVVQRIYAGIDGGPA